MTKYIIQDNKINDICKKIEYLTNSNNHTEALITACNVSGGNLHNIKKALEAIKVLHNYYGCLTDYVSSIRTDLSIALFYELHGILNDEQFKKIKASF